ncbi:UNVERIFIED_CONTAM: hypothetical protein HDU68_005196, partial [Siphonaria sp. JEL0065]
MELDTSPLAFSWLSVGIAAVTTQREQPRRSATSSPQLTVAFERIALDNMAIPGSALSDSDGELVKTSNGSDSFSSQSQQSGTADSDSDSLASINSKDLLVASRVAMPSFSSSSVDFPDLHSQSTTSSKIHSRGRSPTPANVKTYSSKKASKTASRVTASVKAIDLHPCDNHNAGAGSAASSSNCDDDDNNWFWKLIKGAGKIVALSVSLVFLTKLV